MDKKLLERSKKLAQATVNKLLEPARALLARGGEHDCPMMYIEADNGDTDVIPLAMTKAAADAFYRAVALDSRVRVAAVVLEAFMFVQRKDDANDAKIAAALERGDISVEDLPQREEMLCMYVQALGIQWAYGAKIDRAQRVILPGELNSTEGCSGVFVLRAGPQPRRSS